VKAARNDATAAIRAHLLERFGEDTTVPRGTSTAVSVEFGVSRPLVSQIMSVLGLSVGAPPHGTRNRYLSGCACEACREANATYQRQRRRRRRESACRGVASPGARDERSRAVRGLATPRGPGERRSG
jgi:hypothetical protein